MIIKGFAILALFSQLGSALGETNFDWRDRNGQMVIIGGKNSLLSPFIGDETPRELWTIDDKSKTDVVKGRCLRYDHFVFGLDSVKDLKDALLSLEDALPIDDQFVFIVDSLDTAFYDWLEPFYNAEFLLANDGMRYHKTSLLHGGEAVLVTTSTGDSLRYLKENSYRGVIVEASAFHFPPYSIIDHETGEVRLFFLILGLFDSIDFFQKNFVEK